MQWHKNEKGLALPLILIVMLVLALLGSALYMYSMSETSHVARDEKRMKAHYIARSGAHVVAVSLIENPDIAEDLIDSPESSTVDFAGGTFDVMVYGDPTTEIHIESTGIFDDVVQTVVVTVGNFDEAPLITDTINFPGQTGSPEITGGNVYYSDYYNMDESIVKHGELIKMDLDFPSVIPPCNNPDSVFYGVCPPPEHQFSDGMTISVSKGFGNSEEYTEIKTNSNINVEPGENENILIKANEIEMGGGSTLNVTLDNNVVAIVAEEFNSSKIYVEGNGYLVFYVDYYIGNGNLTIDGDSDDVDVNVFITAGGEFQIRGTPNFDGAIYAPDAVVSHSGTGGDGATINGWIVANEFKGSGNTIVNYKPTNLMDGNYEFRFYSLEKWRYSID